MAFRSARAFRVLWPPATVVPSPWGLRPRLALLRRFAATVDEGVRVSHGVRVLGAEGLRLHHHAAVARHALLDSRAGLTIGPHALIGFESMLLTFTHAWRQAGVPVALQGMEGAPILVEEGAWIGTRAIVLPGVVVGAWAVVGAGAVVTQDVEPGQIVAGVPARVVGSRTGAA